MSSSITICSVGDLMICDSPLYASVGVGSKYSQIKSVLFSKCKTVFGEADIVIGNLETVVYEPKNKSLKEIQMCCSEDVIEDLHNTGYNILNIANNHCLQHGTEGFYSTIESCRKYGIQPIGIRNEKPCEKLINGIRLIFFSLCIHLEWYQPDDILYEDQIERILKEIKETREHDERAVIVLSIHWGDEFATYPSNAQIMLGHKFVDLGANIILGHHPHVYQGIEEYNGGIIAYSQGNFVSDMVPKMCRQTGVLLIEITEDNKDNIFSFRFIPYYISDRYCIESSSDEWMREREKYLFETLSKSYPDEEYWRTVSKNHHFAHNDFKAYFRQNITKYNNRTALRMIGEFIGRKIKRIIGTSSDGQVSSMDESIYSILYRS